ncbi:fimbrillin family protein [Viscerimonas tarda]
MNKCKFLAIAAIAAATVMTSCSKDEVENNNADGKLSFASQVSNDPQARATSGNTWDGGETVIVNVSGTEYPFEVAAADRSTLTSATLYWNDYTSIDAYAYYPEVYTYDTDQSDGNGIQDADFIFADKVTGITRTNWGTQTLTFKHKTAKVSVVTLTAGAGLAAGDLTGATVTFYGYTALAAMDITGANPTGAITGSTIGEITPDAGNTALLLPVTLTSENIFKVTLASSQEYYYKSSYTFEAGKSYQFTVQVDKTSLTVKSANILDWDSPIAGSGTAE